MRLFILLASFALFPMAAQAAVDTPPGQMRLGAGQILRGHFAEERQIKSTDNPLQTSGHFVASVDHGLIWAMEKPLPTSTIITPNGIVQDIGGLAMKLPAKNLAHLYAMISEALAGNWNGLEGDFTISRSGSAGHWQMFLTPNATNNLKQTYVAITISGNRFVENVVMTKVNGTYDAITFSDMAASSEPLTAQEAYAYNEVKP